MNIYDLIYFLLIEIEKIKYIHINNIINDMENVNRSAQHTFYML